MAKSAVIIRLIKILKNLFNDALCAPYLSLSDILSREAGEEAISTISQSIKSYRVVSSPASRDELVRIIG